MPSTFVRSKYSSSAHNRVHVRPDGVAIIPGPDEDVRRHMHEMSSSGHERCEPFGAGCAFLRIWGRLDRVDVIVIRAGMARIT